MDLGLFLPTMASRGEVPDRVVAAARHAEHLGFESVWAVDQLVSGTGVPITCPLTSISRRGGCGRPLRSFGRRRSSHR